MCDSEKGPEGGECNRTVCKSEASLYNHSTHKWYCESCAFDIQEFENTMPNPFKIFDKFYIGKELRSLVNLTISAKKNNE